LLFYLERTWHSSHAQPDTASFSTVFSTGCGKSETLPIWSKTKLKLSRISGPFNTFERIKIGYLQTSANFYYLVGSWRATLKVLFEQMDVLPSH
jgi:hypothetical protein